MGKMKRTGKCPVCRETITWLEGFNVSKQPAFILHATQQATHKIDTLCLHWHLKERGKQRRSMKTFFINSFESLLCAKYFLGAAESDPNFVNYWLPLEKRMRVKRRR